MIQNLTVKLDYFNNELLFQGNYLVHKPRHRTKSGPVSLSETGLLIHICIKF